MPTNSYADGTIALTLGSAVVAGTGTAWSTTVKAGDMLLVPVSLGGSPEEFRYEPVVIGTVDSDAQITLQDEWLGEGIASTTYRIVRGYGWWSGAAANETLIQFLTELGPLGLAGVSTGEPNPAEGRENELRCGANGVIYQKVAGSWVVRASGFSFDAWGYVDNSPSDRDQYDDGLGDLATSVGAGLTFLSTGEGGFYVLLSVEDATGSPIVPAVWSDLISLRGPVGDNYTLAFAVAGKPRASEKFRHEFETTVSFAEDFVGSYASADEASTGTATFSITKNGVEVGTLTFDASDAGVFAATGGVSFVPGDILRVVAPATQDATLSDFSITLAGSR
jgi:hypothetical protein